MAAQLCRHVHVKGTVVKQTPAPKKHSVFMINPAISLLVFPSYSQSALKKKIKMHVGVS